MMRVKILFLRMVAAEASNSPLKQFWTEQQLAQKVVGVKFPMTSMPRMAPEGGDLLTLLALVVKIAFLSDAKGPGSVVEGATGLSGPQHLWVQNLHLSKA